MSRHSRTRARISGSFIFVWRRSGKATFSKTSSESNSAPSWKAMPNSRRASRHSRSPAPLMSRPSISTVPSSGRSRPMTCLSSTLLPPPDAPRIATDSPRKTSRSTPRSTGRPSNDLRRPRTAIRGGSPPARSALVSVVAIAAPQNRILVRKKSESRITSELITTAEVVARPTPSAPPPA